MNILADAYNAMLIVNGHPDYIDNGLHPKIVERVYQFDLPGRTPYDIWKSFGNSSLLEEKHEFVQIGRSYKNFMYCGYPQATDSIWKFSTFTDAFRWRMWTLIICSYFLVSIQAYARLQSIGGFPTILFPAFGAMLGLGAAVPKSLGNYGLFVLWMLICSVLVNAFTTQMTSQVIVPPPVGTLATIKELEEST